MSEPALRSTKSGLAPSNNGRWPCRDWISRMGTWEPPLGGRMNGEGLKEGKDFFRNGLLHFYFFWLLTTAH
jgi:hypothetical protein